MNSKIGIYICAVIILFVIAGFVQAQDVDSTKINDKSSFKDLLRFAHNELLNGDYEKALLFSDSAYLLDSTSVDAAYYRASAEVLAGDTARGIDILKGILGISPHSTRIKLLLIKIYLEQGNTAEAINYSDQILAIRPNEGEALYFKGLGLFRTGDTTQAIELFDRAILNSLD